MLFLPLALKAMEGSTLRLLSLELLLQGGNRAVSQQTPD